MSLIKWRDDYSVGIPSVDHEHQELIQSINGLIEAMRAKTDPDQVIHALAEIYANISAHFALEEKVMRDAGYASYHEHKLDHEVLLDELLELTDSIDDDCSYVEEELSHNLDRWFSDHFRTHDAKLHKLLG